MDLKRKIGLCILLGLGILYETLYTLLRTNAYPKIPRAGSTSVIKTITLQTLRAQTDFTCEQCVSPLENNVLRSTRGNLHSRYMGTVSFTSLLGPPLFMNTT